MQKAAPIRVADRSPDVVVVNFDKDVQAALNSVEQGVGHSGEQVSRWMDDWAEGKKRPVPEPDILPNE